MNGIRHSTAAGKIYPADQNEVYEIVRSSIGVSKLNVRTKAIAVPYAPLEEICDTIGSVFSEVIDYDYDEVFILSDSSMHKYEYAAFTDFTMWETPIGNLEQSHKIPKIVSADDSGMRDLMQVDNTKHSGELSIESVLPYLSFMNSPVRIVPVMLGEKISPRILANSLDSFIDPDDLIIVVGNLSSNFPDEYACEIDRESIDALVNLDSKYIESDQFNCSARSSFAFLNQIAQNRGWQVRDHIYQAKEIGSRVGSHMVTGLLGAVYS